MEWPENALRFATRERLQSSKESAITV